MLRRFRLRPAPLAPLPLALFLALVFPLSGCDYSSPDLTEIPEGTYSSGVLPIVPRPTTGASSTTTAAEDPSRTDEKTAILGNVVQLIQSAATNPGGANFGQAIKNLNQYFSGTPTSAYQMSAAARSFLEGSVDKESVNLLEATEWTMPDARHLEDCMLYYKVARRVAGEGDDLARASQAFDWMVRHVQLVPSNTFRIANGTTAVARPYDVLLRGMAVESEGVWSERGWLFLVLCRQLGLDAGLITYTPRGATEPVVWCTAVLIDGTPYLFDTRVGLPIANAKGDGVATLEEAVTDPLILDKMDLPGQSPYGTTSAALLGSASKIGVLIDSGSRYFSPRMKLLQQSLAGKDQTILFRDPAEQRDAWTAALGKRFGGLKLWDLPAAIERLLFTSSEFMDASQQALVMFRSEFPLLYARTRQLRGEVTEAIEGYVSMRFAENATLTDGKTPMPPQIQQALDVHATYFLALSHLDRGDPKQAEFFFTRTLRLVPEPGRGQPYFNMYRWGASANLGRLLAAKGQLPEAIAHYCQTDNTTQKHGNLLSARDLVWREPTARLPKPLPPAPPPVFIPDTPSPTPPPSPLGPESLFQ